MNFRRFLRRANNDEEQARELESYLEMATENYVARGMSPEDARAAARRKLGNITKVREEVYRMNPLAWFDGARGDAWRAVRGLRKNTGFTAVALAALALGIGATAAIFAVVNGVLIRPLPYPDPERLVTVRHATPGWNGIPDTDNTRGTFVTYHDQNETFAEFGIWEAAGVNITGAGEPEWLQAVTITPGVLDALSVSPMGRRFTMDDVLPHAPGAVIVSHGYGQRRFGDAARALGARLTVDGVERTIVGVLPADFVFYGGRADMFVPLVIDRPNISLGGFGYSGVARLKPGVTMERASADVARMIPIWLHQWASPGMSLSLFESARFGPNLKPLKTEVVGNIGTMLWLLLASIGGVLLIACANVANLLLVRADGRTREFAIRASVGAGRGQIAREMAIESLMLGLAGAALGSGVAMAMLRLLVWLGPANLPRLDEIRMDWTVLAFTAALGVGSALLFGILPIVKYASPKLQELLQSAGRTASHSRARSRSRNVLVVAQVALATVLLVCSGLMLRTFAALRQVDPGFRDARSVQMVRVSIPPAQASTPEQLFQMQQQMMEKLGAVPGVQAVTATNSGPLERFLMIDPVWAEGYEYSGTQVPGRFYRTVLPGFAGAIGREMVAGRDFTWDEVYSSRGAALSQNLAEEFWGSAEAAIGKRVRISPQMPWTEVVGVFPDLRDFGVDRPAPKTIYWPGRIPRLRGDTLMRAATFVIRTTRAGTEPLRKEVERAVWQVNPDVPLSFVRTLDDLYRASTARTSFTLVMLALAGGMALVVGAIGLYGVLAYTVGQRLGIRMALGASVAAVKGMFVRQGLAMVIVGIAIGLGAAAGLSRGMTSLLFGVKALEAVTYMVAPVVLLVAALAACYIPARRAARVDPAETLRSE